MSIVCATNLHDQIRHKNPATSAAETYVRRNGTYQISKQTTLA